MDQKAKFNIIGEVPVSIFARSLIPIILALVAMSWWVGWILQKQSNFGFLFSILGTIVSIVFYFTNRKHKYKSVVFGENYLTINFNYKSTEKILISDFEKVFCHDDGPVQIFYSKAGEKKSFYLTALKNRVDHKFLDYLLASGVKFTGANYRAWQPEGPKKD